jgi:FHS family L-fucose permease-like MFS transporter
MVIMAIVGGAVFPVLMGRLSDRTNIQVAYAVPAVCFAVIFYFALTNIRVGKIKLSVAH